MSNLNETAEQKRLNEAREQKVPWKKWGPYLSERQCYAIPLVHCITCFQSALDPIRASTEHFVGVDVL